MDDIRQRILLDTLSMARAAGAVHLSYFRGNELDVHTKLNDSDVVTAADKASEALIISEIHRLYPGHSILSEESGAETTEGSEWRWVIDPLDGTTNFSSGLPAFAVSIGVERNGVTEVGVVFAPYLNELFHAVRGEGAWLNGEPVHASECCRMSEAVVATGFPVDKSENPDNNLDNLTRVLPLVRGVRRLGSAALELCYTAAGFLDAHWELNLHPWDVSAGLLIAAEAGCKSDFFRHDRNISVVTAAPGIYADIRPLLSSAPAK